MLLKKRFALLSLLLLYNIPKLYSRLSSLYPLPRQLGTARPLAEAIPIP